ncbi:hypothetical protein O181_009508 [Austropuccinia psidii MF-1]|uniref:CCHC-type domain-containing protein n=1 Tax=Austropuccinia psidii MF-1 TaxID=1389203 RepID=A0A9Q3GJI1_9BASI|nr:hypothetical protein [Austropuccinia psidii MF-1]
MSGYEEGNWTQLKKDLITKWGRVEPERGYRKDSLVQLINATQDEGGISNLSQYKRFIGEYETIITYLLRYKYIPQYNMFHEDILDCLSSDIKEAINKEMMKENVMVRAEDGGYLIPSMKILRKYIEQELEARVLVTKRLSPPRIAEQKESKNKERRVKFKEEVFSRIKEALKKMKEPKKTLKEQKEVVKDVAPAENEYVKQFMDQLNELPNVVTPQKKIIHSLQSNNQGLRPRDNVAPPPNRSVPYVLAQNSPQFSVKCYYCMEEGHSVRRCTELVEDRNNRWLIRKEGTRGTQKKARGKEQSGGTKEKEKPTAFISMDNWGDWDPPYISTGLEEPFGNAYGLRNTKQRIENQEKSKAQPLPSEEIIHPKCTIKKKTSIPGGFIEEEEAEEEKVIIPTKYKSSKPEEVVKPPEPTKSKPNTSEKEKKTNKKALIKISNMEVNKQLLIEEEGLIIEKVMKKFMDQKINLTLEEIVTISPKFKQELKFLSDKERKYLMSLKSINTQEQTTTQERIIHTQEEITIKIKCITLVPLESLRSQLGKMDI